MEVCYDGSPVPKSPFRVAVTEGCDPARVRVHGPGLKGGITNKPNKFTIETRLDNILSTFSEHEVKSYAQVLLTCFLMPVSLIAEEQELVVLVWQWRVHLRPKCPARITRMAAAVWNMSPTNLAHTTSTSPTEDSQSKVILEKESVRKNVSVVITMF